MAKGYWISAYREIKDSAKLAAYAELAAPAVLANGGRYLVRGGQIEAKEGGVQERTVVLEFDSFSAAVKTYESAQYQEALEKLGDGVVRDFRIVEGVD
jgi:uncharacterized protein (DUF1330 family)